MSFESFRPKLEGQSSIMLDSVTQLVPSGHEKPLRQAFYTAAAILFTVAACITATYLYYILEIFIKPLMWALLCGSFLFPFKYSLQSTLESWLKQHEEIGRPLIVGAILVPISLFDSVAESVGKFVTEKWKAIVVVTAVTSMVYILYMIQLLHIFELALLGIWHATSFIWNSTSASVEFFAQYRIFLITAFGAYTLAAIVFEQRSVPWLEYFAVPAWICLLISIVSIAGSFRAPLGVCLLILIVVGAISALKQTLKEEKVRRVILEGRRSITALWETGSSENFGNSTEDDVDSGVADRANEKNSDESIPQPQTCSNTEQLGKDMSEKREPMRKSSTRSRVNSSQSAVYFNFLFLAFVLMISWMHSWVRLMLIIPFLYWCVKQLLYLKLVMDFLDSCCLRWVGCNLHTAKEKMFQFYKSREDLLLPPTVRAVVDIILKGDRRFNSIVLEALPTITSIIVILILIIGSTSISLFFAVKIQQESFLLVQMTSDLINETVSRHPEYKSWLPDNETMHYSMDSIVDKVYLQGREWITEQVRGNLGTEGNVTLIEKQALKIWDRAYHSWFNKSAEKGKVKVLRRQSTENPLPAGEGGSWLYPGLIDLLSMTEVTRLLKENMSALRSVLESVWSIFQTNVTLIFSSITTTLTILLYGGTAVLNFVLSMVVFLTALFYLLMGSQAQYMPVHLLSYRSGSSLGKKPSPIANSIQDAISGVFGASLKMASFYGFYTWLIHTALGAGLVYIPSLSATIFSVVPILTTYWSCVPAFLELWLLRGDIVRGIVLLILQCAPTFFVDAAIYTELAASGGGHPYVTGLAVVGGLYYFGLEGVIIGPIVLCILLFAINLYFRIINMPTSEAELVPLAEHSLRKSVSDSLLKERVHAEQHDFH